MEKKSANAINYTGNPHILLINNSIKTTTMNISPQTYYIHFILNYYLLYIAYNIHT